MTTPTQQACRGALAIQLGGEELWLLPERAVWWPATATVFIADAHLGKAAAFRAASLPIPDATAADLARLDRILSKTGARRLTILGDLLHNRRGMSAEIVQQVRQWRERHTRLNVDLVSGNHDTSSGGPPTEWNLNVRPAPVSTGPLDLTHYPNWKSERPSLAGHLHPKYRLCDRTEDLRLPCFWLRNQTLVLPAFGTFIDGDLIRGERHRIFVIAETEVIEIPEQHRSI